MGFSRHTKLRSFVAPRVLVLALALVSFATMDAASSGSTKLEHQVKAAAIYNIVAFTDWPVTAFASPAAPLVVGVLGQGPVATLLNDVVANETWQGRRIQLRQLSSVAEARFCHVLFLANSEHARWPSMAGMFERLPILTISDADNFARRGGIIELGVERSKLRLLVNLRSARNAGLTISSKVLRLATVIEDHTP